MKHISKSTLVITMLVIVASVQNLYAQSIHEIKIKEHYWGTPLNKVLSDFQTKYGINIQYDSTLTLPYKFDDRGRFSFEGITVDRAFKAICRDIPALSYYIDENNIVFLEPSIEANKRQHLVNVKYKGEAVKTNTTISGIVKDIDSGETLPFASIAVRKTTNGTVTNIDGYFTLFDVPTDTTALDISYMGYQSATFFLNPEMDLSNVIVLLKPSSELLNEVVINGVREDLMQSGNKISVVKMSAKKIAKLPSVGEKDIFRSFQLLPGVSSSNEASSGLFVRGGTPDQNLILYDGFTVYHVDHLFGMFSAFNSNAIKDLQLHKGGFESQFGGRISSVMEIVGKDGNENDFNIGGDIGLLSVNGFAEIPIQENLTLFLAARRSWKSSIYNDLFEKFSSPTETVSVLPGPSKGNRTMESTSPSSYFYDLNAKLTYKPNNKDIISYSFFNGQDDLDNSSSIDRTRGESVITGGVNDISKWGNWGMSSTWSRKWSNIFYTNTLVSMSNYFSERDLVNSRVITDANGEENEINRGSVEDNNLRDYTLKQDYEVKLGKSNQLEFGLQASHYIVDYDYLLNDTINIQNRHDKGTVASVFLQDRIKLFDKITLVPGIRGSFYDVTGKTYLEPRLSLEYKLNNKIKLKSAWGHYYQFANRIIRNDISSGSRDFWVLADDNTVPISFAEHYILGASYETKGYLIDIEAYYKNLQGLSEYSLQFVPSFTNVNYDELFYEGTGVAKGIDFLLQKKFGKLNGWIGYTLGEVLYDFPIYGEDAFPANHDVTHEFTIVSMYKYKKWTFAATFIYATGKPYTEPIGGYTITLLDGSTEDFLNIGPRNSVRYPDYHRLDLSATTDFKMGDFGIGSLSFSIFNAYNRNNIWYKQFEVEEGELIETDVTLLGITPSVTLSFKLK